MNPASPALPKNRVLATPLKVETLTLARESALIAWTGEAGRVLHPQRRPGFWCPSPDGRVAEVAEKRRLSNTSATPATWYRLEFDTVKEASKYADRLKKEGLGSYVGDDDRWAFRLLVEQPEFFRAHPMTRPLRILVIDVEQYTEGIGAFPKRNAPLVSIGFGHCDGTVPRVVVAPPGPDGMPNDAGIIAALRDELQVYDPDIVVVFNAGYDCDVLSQRGIINGFAFTEWGRPCAELGGERTYTHAYVDVSGKRAGKQTSYYVGGRLLWDVSRNANSVQDYNLAGVKDEKLKTIAKFLRDTDPKWAGVEVIEEDTSDTATLWRTNPARLARYNASDVALTERLVARYLPDRMGMAEFYGAPLDMCLDVPAGWGGNVANARVLFSQSIVSDGTNMTRHRDYLRFLPKGDDDEEQVIQFEGAHVALFKRGLVRPVYKVDFTSLYSNIARATGVGPDNTRIVGTVPITSEPKFRVALVYNAVAPQHKPIEEQKVTNHIFVPDEKYGHTWVIEVRGQSVFRDIIIARQGERNAAKKAGDETRAAILKTMLHATVWGSQGALFSRYGVLAVAIVIVGFARQLIAAIEDGVGDSKVETDTDGVYLDRPASAALLTRRANKVAEHHGFEACFAVEFETYDAAWFHEAKTYLLLKKGRVLRHGVAMKGKALPRAFDRVIEDVGLPLLQGDRDAALAKARGFLDLGVFDPKEFVQRARLNKTIGEYAYETKEVKIAKLYERMYGVEPTVGQSYEYVKTKGGERLPPTPDALRALDSHYYLDGVVLKALERLGFTREELGITDRVQTLKAQAKRPKGEMSLFDFAKAT